MSEIIGRVSGLCFTAKLRDQGTGLGLSISYNLVSDHGGRTAVGVPDPVLR